MYLVAYALPAAIVVGIAKQLLPIATAHLVYLVRETEQALFQTNDLSQVVTLKVTSVSPGKHFFQQRQDKKTPGTFQYQADISQRCESKKPTQAVVSLPTQCFAPRHPSENEPRDRLLA